METTGKQVFESIVPTRRDGITFWAMVGASSVTVSLGLLELARFLGAF